MVLDDEESNGSQHSTSNPNQKKKKKLAVTWKEFHDLLSKVDQILVIVSSGTQQTTTDVSQQYLAKRIQALETREKLTTERMILHIEMGIIQLDNQRTLDHREFISKVKNVIEEVKELNTELQQNL